MVETAQHGHRWRQRGRHVEQAWTRPAEGIEEPSETVVSIAHCYSTRSVRLCALMCAHHGLNHQSPLPDGRSSQYDCRACSPRWSGPECASNGGLSEKLSGRGSTDGPWVGRQAKCIETGDRYSSTNPLYTASKACGTGNLTTSHLSEMIGQGMGIATRPVPQDLRTNMDHVALRGRHRIRRVAVHYFAGEHATLHFLF